LYFFNIRMECEKKFDGIFYSEPTDPALHVRSLCGNGSS
jgi:hypothetical protein